MNESNIENNQFDSSEQNTEVLTKTIADARSIDEIKEIVKKNNGIQGSNRFFSYEEVCELINNIKDSNEDPINLTNRHGLRDKVIELTSIEKNNVTPNVISLLNREEIGKAIASNGLIKVYIKTDDNNLEGGWKIRSFNTITNEVDVYKKGPGDTSINLVVSLDELVLWNTP